MSDTRTVLPRRVSLGKKRNSILFLPPPERYALTQGGQMACGSVMFGGFLWLSRSFHTTIAMTAEKQTDWAHQQAPEHLPLEWCTACLPSTTVQTTLPGTVKQTYLACFELRGELPFPLTWRFHTAWLHPVPSTLSSCGAEWLAHCVMSVTWNPFTALNLCPCPPHPPPPPSNDTLPPFCPMPTEDDESPSAP